MRRLFIPSHYFILSLLLVITTAFCLNARDIQDQSYIKKQIETLISKPNSDTHLENLKFALSLCLPNKLYQEEGIVRLKLAEHYIANENTTEAFQELRASQEIFESLGDSVNMVSNLRQFGNYYNLINQMNRCTEYYLAAYELALELQLEEEITILINNLAVVFNSKGLYDKAIKHYRRSLERGPSIDVKVAVLGNIALAFMKKQEFDSASLYLDRAMITCEDSEDKNCTLTPLSHITMMYQLQSQLDSALKYSDLLIEKYKGTNLESDLLVRYNQRGLIFLNMNRPKKAIQNFRKSLVLAKKLIFDRTHLLLANLAFSYERLGRFDSAYYFMTYHLDFRDSIDRANRDSKVEDLLIKYEAREKEQEIALLQKENDLKKVQLINQQSQFEKNQLKEQLEAQAVENRIEQLKATNEIQYVSLQKEKFEKEKKENQIQLLEKEKELKQAEVDRQKVIQLATILVAGLIILAVLILLVVYRQKEKATKQLSIQAEEINQQKTKELLRENEMKEIRASISGQESERIRIAKELHDSVAGNLAGIKLGLERLSAVNGNQEILQQVKKNIDQTYDEVRSISANLSPIKSKEIGFISFLENYLNDLQKLHSFEIELNHSIQTAFSLMDDHTKLEIYRILQELMNNVVKHSNARFIEISINEVDGSINIIVEDDGNGFDIKTVKKGMGLKNIYSRIDQLNGLVNVDSAPKRGTIVNLDIPMV
jgi:signal transduction histidine kinase